MRLYEAAHISPWLFAACLNAPVIGVDIFGEYHAVTLDDLVGLYSASAPVDHVPSACGVNVKLLRMGDDAAPWPPRVSTLPAGHERCKKCHQLTGRKRPRTEYRPVNVTAQHADRGA